MEGMSFDTPKGKMTFRKEDHQAMQSMYHFKIKNDPALAWGVPELVREIKPEEMNVIRNSADRSAGGGYALPAFPPHPPAGRSRKSAHAANPRSHHPLWRAMAVNAVRAVSSRAR
jgi:hypothetical protein